MSDAHINLSKAALAIMEQLTKPRTYLYRNPVATIDVDKEETYSLIHVTDKTVDEVGRDVKHPLIMITGQQFSSKTLTPIALQDALAIRKHPQIFTGHVYDPDYDPTRDLRPLDYFWFRRSLSKSALTIMEQLSWPRTYLYRNMVEGEDRYYILQVSDGTVDETYRGHKYPYIVLTLPQFHSGVQIPIATFDALEILKYSEIVDQGFVFESSETDRPSHCFWFRRYPQ